MKRRLSLIFALGLALSMTACAQTAAEEDTGYSSIAAAAAETYTGTVTEINLEHLVLSTDEGDVTILYSEDTEFSGFSSGGSMGAGQMNGGGAMDMGEAPGDPGAGMNASGQDTFQDITGDETTENSAEEELPATLEETSADTGEVSSEQDGGDSMPQEAGGMEQQTSSVEEVSLNDEVTVVVGEDGIAESVTRNTEAGAGGEMGGTSSAPEDYDAATEYTSDTEVSG